MYSISPTPIFNLTAFADTIIIQRTGTETSEICFDNSDCSSEFYCEKAVGDCTGEGVCTEKPDVCILVIDPVCGCNGVTMEMHARRHPLAYQ